MSTSSSASSGDLSKIRAVSSSFWWNRSLWTAWANSNRYFPDSSLVCECYWVSWINGGVLNPLSQSPHTGSRRQMYNIAEIMVGPSLFNFKNGFFFSRCPSGIKGGVRKWRLPKDGSSKLVRYGRSPGSEQCCVLSSQQSSFWHMWFIFEPYFAAPNCFGSVLPCSPAFSFSLSLPLSLYLFIFGTDLFQPGPKLQVWQIFQYSFFVHNKLNSLTFYAK